MLTMVHYSIKEHASYTQEKEKISYPVDFTAFHITGHIFFEHTTQLVTHSMHWNIHENLLNELHKQSAINLKSLRVLVLLCDENEVSLPCM